LVKQQKKETGMARKLPPESGVQPEQNGTTENEFVPKSAEELLFAAMGGNNRGKKPKPAEVQRRFRPGRNHRVHY